MDNLFHLSKGIGGKVNSNKGIGGNSSQKDANGCFIEVLASEKPLFCNIDILRQYRDKVLISSHSGKFIIASYYNMSPKLIVISTRYPFLKTTFRWSISLSMRIIQRVLA